MLKELEFAIICEWNSKLLTFYTKYARVRREESEWEENRNWKQRFLSILIFWKIKVAVKMLQMLTTNKIVV